MQFKFFPKKKGKYKYKLYLLTVINGNKRVIVTVEGNCIIQSNPVFEFYLSNEIFKLKLKENNYDYLWIRNSTSETIKIQNISGFGNYLKINYPKNFNQKELESLKISKDLKK